MINLIKRFFKDKKKDDSLSYYLRFFSAFFYKNHHVDLGDYDLDSCRDHYIKYGHAEGRLPNFIFIELHNKKSQSALDVWYKKPNLSIIESKVWDFYIINYDVKNDCETLVDLIQILDIWEVTTEEVALLFLFAFLIEGDLDKARSRRLPEYFSKRNIKAKDDVEIFREWALNYQEFQKPFLDYFDEAYYIKKYKDLEFCDDVFHHYIVYGRNEGRICSPLFNEYFYVEEYKMMKIKGLLLGLEKKPKFLSACEHLIERNGGGDLDNLKDKIEELSLLFKGVFKSYEEFEFFSKLLNTNYMKAINPALKGDLVELLKSWKKSGCACAFSPLFDREDLGVDRGWLAAYLNWYRSGGKKNKVLPTGFFNEWFYQNRYLDLKNLPYWSYEHYVKHGQFENRQPNPLFDPLWLVNHYGIRDAYGIDYYYKMESLGKSLKPCPSMMPINATLETSDKRWLPAGVSALIKKEELEGLTQFSQESELYKQIEKASEIDSSIKVVDPSRLYSVMPFNSDVAAYIRRFSKMVGKAECLIFRDSINFGGADIVLKHLYHSLVDNSMSPIIISTGEVDWAVVKKHGIERSHVIDLSKGFGMELNYLSKDLIYDLVIGSQAKSIFNVNCYQLWECIRDYGKILKLNCEVNAFLFCDDRDQYGNVAGYPAEYFIDTISYLNILYVDSKKLKKELEGRVCGSDLLSKKIVVANTPFEKEMKSTKDYVRNFDEQAKVKIAWVGRFDEQKCPDILREIAVRMPEVDFLVWGKSILSNKNYQLDTVSNIKLMGLYDRIEEVSESGSIIYLYTSAWDGVPTILLRMLEEGLPIIASDVGGVKEVLPDVALIKDYKDVDLYVSKINEYLSNLKEVSQVFDSYKSELYVSRSLSSINKVLLEKGAVS